MPIASAFAVAQPPVFQHLGWEGFFMLRIDLWQLDDIPARQGASPLRWMSHTA